MIPRFSETLFILLQVVLTILIYGAWTVWLKTSDARVDG